MKYLYLAEKPSAMKAVKTAYNSSNKPLGDIDFFALAGHVNQKNMKTGMLDGQTESCL